jgi:hypothetical protein
MLGEQRLGLGPAQARLEGDSHRDRIDVEQPLHPDQVEGQDTGVAVAAGGQAAGDAGAATERDHGQVVLDREGEHRRHVVVVAGSNHRVGSVVQLSGAGAEQVGRGLAAGADPSGLVVGEHVLGAQQLAEAIEQPVVDLAGREARVLDRGPLNEAEGQLDQAAGGVGEWRGGGRVAPAGRVHLVALDRHALQCDTWRHFVTLRISTSGKAPIWTPPAHASSTSAGGVRRSPRWPVGPGSPG